VVGIPSAPDDMEREVDEAKKKPLQCKEHKRDAWYNLQAIVLGKLPYL
jgi:hypothetical protein